MTYLALLNRHLQMGWCVSVLLHHQQLVFVEHQAALAELLKPSELSLSEI